MDISVKLHQLVHSAFHHSRSLITLPSIPRSLVTETPTVKWLKESQGPEASGVCASPLEGIDKKVAEALSFERVDFDDSSYLFDESSFQFDFGRIGHRMSQSHLSGYHQTT